MKLNYVHVLAKGAVQSLVQGPLGAHEMILCGHLQTAENAENILKVHYYTISSKIKIFLKLKMVATFSCCWAQT